MSKEPELALSDLENKVMNIIWLHGEVTADLVRNELESEPPLKDSTIRTILRRLEEKGYAAHRSEGRTYIYAPMVESQRVAADAVQRIIERLCNGSVEDLLVGMVDREVVSPDTLRELAQKIARAQSRSKTTNTKTHRRKGK